MWQLVCIIHAISFTLGIDEDLVDQSLMYTLHVSSNANHLLMWTHRASFNEDQFGLRPHMEIC